MSGVPQIINGIATTAERKYLFMAFTRGVVFTNEGANPIALSFQRPNPVTVHAEVGGFQEPAEVITVVAGESFPADGSFGGEIITDGFWVKSTGGNSAFTCTGLV